MKPMNNQALLTWYRANKRELPFRKNRDPYRIWISEIMAQQTRIEAMLDHYQRFMELFPDIAALASADDDLLMKAWQGLGYYSRARSLKKAAQVCMEQYGGKLPETKAELMKLPGIGAYTAGAIASIAHGERVSAVDGNVIRVYSRFLELDDDFSVQKNRRILEQLVQADLPESEDMPDWNQALMELGAMVCTPKIARCSLCPLQAECKSAKSDYPERLPLKKKKAPRPIEEKTICVQAAIDEDGQVWIHLNKRPSKGLLAGLYEFDEMILDPIFEHTGLGSHHHVFSHVEWIMSGVLVLTEKRDDFITLEDAKKNYSIPSALQPFFQRACQILAENDQSAVLKKFTSRKSLQDDEPAKKRNDHDIRHRG